MFATHDTQCVEDGREQTDWQSPLPTCRIALHHVCHHTSPLLNSVSTTPGFKPSRHAPVAWSKGGATDGTRPDLHLPPPPPPPQHTQTLSLAGRSTSSAAAAAAAATTIWTTVPSDRPAAFSHASALHYIERARCISTKCSSPLKQKSTVHEFTNPL
jgi:hypothetical protein